MFERPLRIAYRCAHLALRSYWFVRRPETHGALAALWFDGRILLVKNSYRKQYSLPGGYVRPGEEPAHAASREVREEIRVNVPPSAFELAYHGTKKFEFRLDTLDIFEAHLTTEPAHRIDEVEVVWAGLKTPAEARAMKIVPHLAEYLERF
ncbi:MAG TPA: NUDIX hydrolase [Polyangiaceae bacterium]|nr:NUDIX hydrolase [Polyangiaceae bacterium]